MRAALLSGVVRDQSGQALSGVIVDVRGHLEYGWTTTDAEGAYELVVNGGDWLTLEYEDRSSGRRSTVRRQAFVGWQASRQLDDVVMVLPSTTAHAVQVPSAQGPSPAQIFKQTTVAGDGDTRTILVFVPADTTFDAVWPDGRRERLDDGASYVHLRVTEYTLGRQAETAMPADLPATTAYTFAVSLELDEARALYAPSVEPSNPIAVYVVATPDWLSATGTFDRQPCPGDLVPVGYYERDEGAWQPEPNGRFVYVTGRDLVSRAALIDATYDSVTGGGCSLPPTASASTHLDALGINGDERQMLGVHYLELLGAPLWRVQLTHFSDYDFNPGQSVAVDTVPPEFSVNKRRCDGDCTVSGSSTIEVQNRVLSESLHLESSGTLHYRSDRVAGADSSRSLDIAVGVEDATGGLAMPAGVNAVALSLHVAGRRLSPTTVPPAGSLAGLYRFEWDGLDSDGTLVTEPVPATLDVTWRYQTSYLLASDKRTSFGGDAPPAMFARFPDGGMAPLGPTRESFKITRSWRGTLGTFLTGSEQLGGWALTDHHRLVPRASSVYFGDGRVTDLSDARFQNVWLHSLTGEHSSYRVEFDGQGSLYFVRDGHLWRTSLEPDYRGVRAEMQITNDEFGPFGVDATGQDAKVTAFDVSPEGDIYALVGDEMWKIEQTACTIDSDCASQSQGVVGVCKQGFCALDTGQSPQCISDLSECPANGALCDFGCVRAAAFCGSDCYTPIHAISFPYFEQLLRGGLKFDAATLSPTPDGAGLAIDPEGRVYLAIRPQNSYTVYVLRYTERLVRVIASDGSTHLEDRSRLAVNYLPQCHEDDVDPDGSHGPEPGCSPTESNAGEYAAIADAEFAGGALYIGFAHCVRRVSPVFNGGAWDHNYWLSSAQVLGNCYEGASIPFVGESALDSRFDTISGIDIGETGSLYATVTSETGDNGMVVAVDAGSGETRCLMGCDWAPSTMPFASQEGLSPAQYRLRHPRDVAVSPDGRVFVVAQSQEGVDGIVGTESPLDRLSTVDPELGPVYRVPDPELELVYVFDRSGYHLRTLHGLTGATLLDFFYEDFAGETLLTGIRDAEGRRTTIERDATSGKALAVLGPLHSTSLNQRTVLEIDASGDLTRVTAPDGRSWSMTYAPGGLLESFTNPRLATSNYTYTADGLLERAISADGLSREFADTLQGSERVATMTTGLGRTTTLTRSLLSSGERNVLAPGGESVSGHVGVFLRPDDANYRDTVVTRASGEHYEVDFTPDPRVGAWRPFASKGDLTVPAEYGASPLASTASVSSSLTRYAGLFDFTQETTVTSGVAPSQLIRKLVVAADPMAAGGGLWSSTISSGTTGARPATANFDVLGRPTLVDQPSPLADITYGYYPSDPGFNPSDPLSVSRDPRAGQLRTVTQGSRVTTYDYDPHGRIRTVEEPLLLTTQYFYDAAGRVELVRLPDNREIVYGYDANGNITTVTPPHGRDHTFGFTLADQTDTYSPPIGTATTWQYNADRQVDLLTRPDGTTVDFLYADELGGTGGRLSRVVPSDLVSATKDYVYDAKGRLDVATTSEGIEVDFAWDGPLLRRAAWSLGPDAWVETSYDQHHRVLSQTVGGQTLDFYYADVDGLLTDVTESGSGAGGRGVHLRYNASTGLLAEQCVGTYGTGCTGVRDQYTYNEFGEVMSHVVVHTSSGQPVAGGQVFSEVFTRDGAGRIETAVETRLGVQTSLDYFYDAAGRLERVKEQNACEHAYVYDANSNRSVHYVENCAEATTYEPAYDEADRVVSYGDVSYGFDANGVLQHESSPRGAVELTYDAFGNQLAAYGVDAETGLAVDVKYFHDAFDRRVVRSAADQKNDRRWIYAGGHRLVAQLDDLGALELRFLYGARSHVPAAFLFGGYLYAMVTDVRGSVRYVVQQGAPSAVLQELAYGPFGEETLRRGDDPWIQPLGYAGGMTDASTGLVRFGARDYDPRIGRWTALDPILFGGGDTNLYGYVLNDPVNFTDPSGLLRDSISANPQVAMALAKANSTTVVTQQAAAATLRQVLGGAGTAKAAAGLLAMAVLDGDSEGEPGEEAVPCPEDKGGGAGVPPGDDGPSRPECTLWSHDPHTGQGFRGHRPWGQEVGAWLHSRTGQSLRGFRPRYPVIEGDNMVPSDVCIYICGGVPYAYYAFHGDPCPVHMSLADMSERIPLGGE